MNTNPLVSEAAFKHAFTEGLIRLLNKPSSGTFILALANAFQQKEIYQQNSELIKGSYSYLQDYYTNCKQNNTSPDDAADDIIVMQAIFDIGLDNLEPIEHKQLKENDTSWTVDYNQLRSLRPARLSQQTLDSIKIDFTPDGFHFNKKFLDKEIFIEQVINGKSVTWLYNKFPFCDYHGLLVIDREKQLGQFMSEEVFQNIMPIYSSLAKSIPDLVFAYNSLAAGASINHLHIQTSISDRLYTVESSVWVHHGGKISYPAVCHLYDNAEDCWLQINDYQSKNIPFNIIFKNKNIYLLPRKQTQENLLGINVTWYEMAGNFSFTSIESFNTVKAEQLFQVLTNASFK